MPQAPPSQPRSNNPNSPAPLGYTMAVRGQFCAANCLSGYQFKGLPDDLHGHTFSVEATYWHPGTLALDAKHRAMKLGLLRQALNTALAAFDHQVIHELPQFANQPTSVELMAQTLFGTLHTALPSLVSLTVWDKPDQAIRVSRPIDFTPNPV